MNLLLVAPLLIPLAAAVLLLLLRFSLRAQYIISFIAGLSSLGAAIMLVHDVASLGIHVTRIGNWPAPFGIVLVADMLSALMVILTSVIGFTVIVYSIIAVDKARQRFGYFPLLQILLMGVSGAFLTGDMFNLFVWFEVMLIASFVLLVMGGERAQLQGAIKYVTLNLFSSILFLIGVGILYGKLGTLNFADIAEKLSLTPDAHLINVSAVLFLVAFGIKSAIFPFFFWLPDSYHVPPVAVTALFSGLLTKVGIYALLRTFSMIFVYDAAFTQQLFLVLAGFTMVLGVIGAVAQGEMRRLLSFHIISQIGYALMGLALFSHAAFSGAIYFIIHVAIAKTALFFVTGYILAVRGQTELKHIGGFFKSAPVLATLFLLAAFSLAGLPPFSGFFAKFMLVKAGLDAGQYAIVVVALSVSVLTLFSMTKIWNEAFWKVDPATDGKGVIAFPALSKALYFLPLIILAALTLLMGIGAEWIFGLTGQAATELLNPELYIRAVLGGAL